MNYRIVEQNRRIWIEESIDGNKWEATKAHHIPQFHRTLEDARSWVATIKRGVVYHDAEDAPSTVTSMWERYSAVGQELNATSNQSEQNDAPNLAQDERKAEHDTSDGIKPLEWFEERIDNTIVELRTSRMYVAIGDHSIAKAYHQFQTERGYRYKDQP